MDYNIVYLLEEEKRISCYHLWNKKEFARTMIIVRESYVDRHVHTWSFQHWNSSNQQYSPLHQDHVYLVSMVVVVYLDTMTVKNKRKCKKCIFSNRQSKKKSNFTSQHVNEHMLLRWVREAHIRSLCTFLWNKTPPTVLNRWSISVRLWL